MTLSPAVHPGFTPRQWVERLFREANCHNRRVIDYWEDGVAAITVEQRDAVDALVAAIRAEGAEENRKLREALKKYGRHKGQCASRGPVPFGNKDDWKCDCGLDSALAEGRET